MGLFSGILKLFGIGNSKDPSYERLVMYIEGNYGKINKEDYEEAVLAKFTTALEKEKEKYGEKAVAGLKAYIEKGAYKGLLKK